MNRKLIQREATSLLQLIARSKPFDWIATGALVIILAWPKKVIWRPWPEWLTVTAMVIGGALVAVGVVKWLLSLKAARLDR
ncbi:hypothetical protein D3C85_674440 [compost metagenome]